MMFLIGISIPLPLSLKIKNIFNNKMLLELFIGFWGLFIYRVQVTDSRKDM